MKGIDQNMMLNSYDVLVSSIRKRMRETKTSMSRVGAEIGIDSTAMSHKFSGRRVFRVSELLKICDLLGLEVTITEKKGTTE